MFQGVRVRKVKNLKVSLKLHEILGSTGGLVTKFWRFTNMYAKNCVITVRARNSILYNQAEFVAGRSLYEINSFEDLQKLSMPTGAPYGSNSFITI